MGPKEREIQRRLRVLEHAEKIGNVCLTCRCFGLARSPSLQLEIRCCIDRLRSQTQADIRGSGSGWPVVYFVVRKAPSAMMKMGR